jgi:sigma-54 dependent transcriptional regulator, acetoin dehydrogenase operon transcriptional activator AcoR
LDRELNRRTEREWSVMAANGLADSSSGAIVQESWHRSLNAGVSVGLLRAPLALDGDSLAAALERNDWLTVAADVAGRNEGAGDRHVLTLFDADGCMLRSGGDPELKERLADINFTPGGHWGETVVGTNGPGTALALGRPVHVVGAEHYCEAWQGLHCAAAPIRHPSGGAILGALDITGAWERADPRLFALVRALAFGIERALAARELERRCRILQAFSEVIARYPGEIVIAVDRYGQVLSASSAAPPEFHPGRDTAAPTRVALAMMVADGDVGGHRPAAGLLGPESEAGAIVYPVAEGGVRIGGSILLRRTSRGGSHKHPPRRSTRYSFLDLVGQSNALAEASRIAGIAAANTLPVLLLGESGVGKELFAQSIHSASERRDHPFIAVNCGAIPSELIESELFGYAGGAYSGARREGSAGKFEAADGGTLFLDEVGELPPTAQTALLRALQEGEITRVGETNARQVDVRIIAATNRDLGVALEEGDLRVDLYYRLAVLTIELPPLRNRREDIPMLAQHFLDQALIAVRRQGLTIDPEAVAALSAYDWPGNVRELQNVIARAAALATGSRLTLADLPAAIRGAPGTARTARLTTGEHPVAAPKPGSEPASSPTNLDPERARLLEVIAKTSTMAEAAQVLGVTRSTLYRRLQRYGLQPKRVFGG